jgi:phage baseplate assembly protein W
MSLKKEKTPTTPVVYKDFDLGFTKNPVTGDIFKKTNQEAIKKAIKNLVLMNFFDVPFQPSIGSNVRNFLFENDTPYNRVLLKNYIIETIENFEPRVSVIDVEVTIPNTNAYDIKIVYYFENIPDQLVSFNLILERVR